LFDACGEICSNYQAEITALEVALYHLRRIFDMFPSKAQNIVIFTDSMSALQALKDGGHCKTKFAQKIQDTNHLIITSYDIKIAMQCLPGHSNTPGNDKADKLAKKDQEKKNRTHQQLCKRPNSF
jgi:ribonuclease HI